MTQQHTQHSVSPGRFMASLFASVQAKTGGVVKRKVSDVERFVGRKAFFEEVAARNFQLVENGNNFVVFCNEEPITSIDPTAPLPRKPEPKHRKPRIPNGRVAQAVFGPGGAVQRARARARNSESQAEA